MKHQTTTTLTELFSYAKCTRDEKIAVIMHLQNFRTQKMLEQFMLLRNK